MCYFIVVILLEFYLAGMKRIMSLSEGVRESLRRLSNVTWMAEELLKVADYFQPNKWVSSLVLVLMIYSTCFGF